MNAIRKEIIEMAEESVKEIVAKGFTEEQALRNLLYSVSQKYVELVDEKYVELLYEKEVK